MKANKKLYLKTGKEKIEVRIAIDCHTDNDSLYVRLETASKDNPEQWIPYRDITVNIGKLPPYYAFVNETNNDGSQYNIGEFLVKNKIAKRTQLIYKDLELFEFNWQCLKELVPEGFKKVSRKLTPGIYPLETITYQNDYYPVRYVHGEKISIYELEEALFAGMGNMNVNAFEMLDDIYGFCSEEELFFLSDDELSKIINE